MPITASLGALSYTRLSGSSQWYLQFLDQSEIIKSEKVGKKLYFISNKDNLPSNQTHQMNVISLNITAFPTISWERQINAISFPDFSSICTQTSSTTHTINVGAINTNYPLNAPVRFSGAVFGGVSAGTTYYVKSYSGSNYITISLTPGGTRFNLSGGVVTGSMIIARYFGGTDAFLTNYSIKYNHFNNSLYTTSSMYTYIVGRSDQRGQPGYICKMSNIGIIQSNYLDNSTQTTWTGLPIRNINDIAFFNSTDYLTVENNTALDTYVVGTQSYKRQNNETTQAYQYKTGVTNIYGSPDGLGYANIDSAGNGIVINGYYVAPAISGGNLWGIEVNKINPTTGASIWNTTFNPGQDSYSPTYPRCGVFRGAVMDSNDNIYIVSQEEWNGLPNNSYGSFIIKLNSAGSVVWQKHIKEVQFTGIDIDASGDLVVTGKSTTGGSYDDTGIYVAKFAYNGSLIWCNVMYVSNPMVTYKMDSRDIKCDEEFLIVAGNLKTIPLTNTIISGVIFRVLADGTISGGGNYNVSNSSGMYTLNYITQTLTVSDSTLQYTIGSLTQTSVNSTVLAVSPTITNIRSSVGVTYLR